MPWIDLPPCRESNHTGILGDIESRTQPGYPVHIDNQDRVTDGHEQCHVVHAGLRNTHKAEGYYCLAGRAYIVPYPSFKLSDVADAMPAIFRQHPIFNLYLQGNALSAWNDRPLYVLDEHVCYVNGSMIALESDDRNRSAFTMVSFERALWTWDFVQVARDVAEKKHDAALDELELFLTGYYRMGVGYLTGEYIAKGWI